MRPDGQAPSEGGSRAMWLRATGRHSQTNEGLEGPAAMMWETKTNKDVSAVSEKDGDE